MDEREANYFIDGYGIDPRRLVRVGQYFMGDLAQLQRDAVLNHIDANRLVHKDILAARAANRAGKLRSRSQSRSRSNSSNNNKGTKRKKNSQ